MLFFFLSLSPSLSPSFATFDELFVVRAECIYQSRVWSVTRRELSRRKCERLSAKTETREWVAAEFGRANRSAGVYTRVNLAEPDDIIFIPLPRKFIKICLLPDASKLNINGTKWKINFIGGVSIINNGQSGPREIIFQFEKLKPGDSPGAESLLSLFFSFFFFFPAARPSHRETL